MTVPQEPVDPFSPEELRADAFTDISVDKAGTGWKSSGTLKPMIAKDGTHYADNVKINGPGQYHVTYRISPPVANGFLRHTDKETGVPDWWKPFSVDFRFKYPQE